MSQTENFKLGFQKLFVWFLNTWCHEGPTNLSGVPLTKDVPTCQQVSIYQACLDPERMPCSSGVPRPGVQNVVSCFILMSLIQCRGEIVGYLQTPIRPGVSDVDGQTQIVQMTQAVGGRVSQMVD